MMRKETSRESQLVSLQFELARDATTYPACCAEPLCRGDYRRVRVPHPPVACSRASAGSYSSFVEGCRLVRRTPSVRPLWCGFCHVRMIHPFFFFFQAEDGI